MRRIILTLLLLICTACASTNHQDQLVLLERQTGLKEVPSPDGKGLYLGKEHNGYEILFTTQMGDVWGRFAARIAIGELRSFLSHGKYRGSVTGSQLDRLLSRAIGQPLTLILIAKHNKPEASRLDIITPFATVQSGDPQPKAYYIGMNTGSIYSADKDFADRVHKNEKLMEAISNLYSPYIRVDGRAVTYIYSGPETDLSAMIRQHGSYAELINSIMQITTTIADLA